MPVLPSFELFCAEISGWIWPLQVSGSTLGVRSICTCKCPRFIRYQPRCETSAVLANSAAIAVATDVTVVTVVTEVTGVTEVIGESSPAHAVQASDCVQFLVAAELVVAWPAERHLPASFDALSAEPFAVELISVPFAERWPEVTFAGPLAAAASPPGAPFAGPRSG